MRPAIATVVGPGWEPHLAAHIRTTGRARLVGRCCDPSALDDIASRADAVFIGSDVPWLGDVDLRDLATRTRVVGVSSDRPGTALLHRAGIEEVIEASAPPASLLALILSDLASVEHHLIEVTGPRGAPGRSEVALALAFETGGHLIEADRAAPSLGLRMGLPPDQIRTTHDHGEILLSPEPVGVSAPADGDLLARLGTPRATTIVDAGPDSTWHRTMTIDVSVIVGEATDIGIIRLARLCERWMGAMPALVINRHLPDQNLRQVIRATGLEPAAVIPWLPPPDPGTAPHPRMRAAIRGLVGQRTAR